MDSITLGTETLQCSNLQDFTITILQKSRILLSIIFHRQQGSVAIHCLPQINGTLQSTTFNDSSFKLPILNISKRSELSLDFIFTLFSLHVTWVDDTDDEPYIYVGSSTHENYFSFSPK
jgi:hypothetical protein